MECQVRVLLFAKAREIAGVADDLVEIPRRIHPGELIEIIVQKYRLEDIKDNFILAVNQEFVGGSEALELKDNDEIAVIPPLSGGIYS
ncbi:molybdopterin synthase sulfur carrier subunit [Fopius arisanus]|uniref:Molybdopterin synthase sulfur carrier subunit n=1 Tax=Fopius arisanus TaxID=64838 RepID=A0A9R1TCV8_9HYME|nr:PREDICTED: molybdopterin synthase sulfur carrier subunit [Fopius arisanus]